MFPQYGRHRMYSAGPGGVMNRWYLSAGLVDTQSHHSDWEGGDAEEIFLDLLRSKYAWG